MTFATLAMNNGASAEATSLATKHRDPKTLLGYVAPNQTLLMQAALTIGAQSKIKTIIIVISILNIIIYRSVGDI